MKETFKKLDDFGFDTFFESSVNEAGADDASPARVIAEHKGSYKVRNTDGEFLAKVTGKQMFTAVRREDYPAVGDWVLILKTDGENAIIKSILPRKTIIKRRFGDKNRSGEKGEVQVIATNIDVGFVIESVDRDFNLNRFERYFAILEDGGVQGSVILNKIDLLTKESVDNTLQKIKDRFPKVDIIMTSTVSSDGIGVLRDYIEKGKTYCFLGSSGVGKSSLINKLIGEEIIKTSSVSTYSHRGKHTTTRRQMYFLDNGGIVVDNPGIREVGMVDIGVGIDNFFDEITSLGETCKYLDCTHTHEPDCVVLSAIKSGKLDKEKYANYITLKKEAEYQDLNNSQKKQKSKDFGKFVNSAKKDLKNLGYDNS